MPISRLKYSPGTMAMDRTRKLFGALDEAEMREDIDLAVQRHEVDEVRAVEEFILSHEKLFKDVGGRHGAGASRGDRK